MLFKEDGDVSEPWLEWTISVILVKCVYEYEIEGLLYTMSKLQSTMTQFCDLYRFVCALHDLWCLECKTVKGKL